MKNTRIILINPPSHDAKKGYKSAIFPPLGILYIAAVLKKAGYNVKVIDYFLLRIKKDYNKETLKNDLKEFNPHIVGVAGFSSNILDSNKTLDAVKETLPDTITIIGGPHITAVPEHLKKIKSADYGIFAEAEQTILELADHIEKKESIEDIPGIIYKKGNDIKFIKRDFVKDLDTMPLPARELVPMELYQPSPATYKQLPATAIITSRGCPFSCIYCQKAIFGRTFRCHSAEYVLNEIQLLHDKYGIKDITIYDDTFTLKRERVVQICNSLIEGKLGITWNCTTRVDTVDYDLLKLMKKAGCYSISFGVESGSERILKMVKKGFTKERLRQVFRWTKELGISTLGYFILGLPTQTKEEMLETIKFSKEIDADMVQFTLVNPYPDTELYELCKKYGKVNIGDWSNFTTYSNVNAQLPFVPDTVTENELKKLYKKAILSFYFRPKYILKEAKKIFKSEKPVTRIINGIKIIWKRV